MTIECKFQTGTSNCQNAGTEVCSSCEWVGVNTNSHGTFTKYKAIPSQRELFEAIQKYEEEVKRVRRGYLKLTHVVDEAANRTASLLLPVGQIGVLDVTMKGGCSQVMWGELVFHVQEPYAVIERMIKNACGIAEG